MNTARKIVARVCNEHKNSDLRADNKAVLSAIDAEIADVNQQLELERVNRVATEEQLQATNRLVAGVSIRNDALDVELLRLKGQLAAKDAALREGILQIEYLEQKFNARTGSGEAVKARMRVTIQTPEVKADPSQAENASNPGGSIHCGRSAQVDAMELRGRVGRPKGEVPRGECPDCGGNGIICCHCGKAHTWACYCKNRKETTCETCDGTGELKGIRAECPECKGDREVCIQCRNPEYYCTCASSSYGIECIKCAKCNGAGIGTQDAQAIEEGVINK